MVGSYMANQNRTIPDLAQNVWNLSDNLVIPDVSGFLGTTQYFADLVSEVASKGAEGFATQIVSFSLPLISSSSHFYSSVLIRLSPFFSGLFQTDYWGLALSAREFRRLELSTRRCRSFFSFSSAPVDLPFSSSTFTDAQLPLRLKFPRFPYLDLFPNQYGPQETPNLTLSDLAGLPAADVPYPIIIAAEREPDTIVVSTNATIWEFTCKPSILRDPSLPSFRTADGAHLFSGCRQRVWDVGIRRRSWRNRFSHHRCFHEHHFPWNRHERRR